ncbi:MAG: VWA domain-containing protein, partial [Taibaiella sp.]|nr:VWA domain-containing protein [Taibaiella sp.]
LLDGSSSMLHEWTKDNIRFEAAAKIIDRLMDSVYSVNKDVEFALRVYGHQFPTSANNCFDSKLEVMFSRDNYTQMQLRLAALHPLGISPIAYSIQKAAEQDMENLRDNKYSLILITDGGESCEGDICKVVEELLRKKIDFKPYILSLVDYAPLRKQYECMGEYLLVTKPDEIEPVVGKIVESYRTTFIQPVAVTKAIETSRKAPSVLKVTTPEFKVKVPDPEPEPEPKKEVVVAKPEPVAPPVPAPPPPAPVRPSKIVVGEVTPKAKQDVIILGTTRKRILPVMYFSKGSFTTVNVPALVISIPEPEPVPAPERPKEPVYKPMTPAPTTKTPVATVPRPAPKTTEYKVTREETGETTLVIHFTDGKGKYYQTAPEVVLRDMKTNEPVHKFDRDVDVYGKPKPQKGITPGTYNVTVTGKDGIVWQAVEVRPNNKNQYEFIVTSGSLGFTYPNNPQRPVKEFSARVSPAFKRANVVKQACTEVLPYEPDNYHIEISTNPISVRNTDLDFGVTVYLSVDEPGQVKVYNPKGFKSEFHYQHGERYERFQPINVKGNASEFEFLIQPGRYKLFYIADPLVPNPQPKMKPFIIKSNTITELTLD